VIFERLYYAPWELRPVLEPLPPFATYDQVVNAAPAARLHFRHDWGGHRYVIPVVGAPGVTVAAPTVPPAPPPPPGPAGKVGSLGDYTASAQSSSAEEAASSGGGAMNLPPGGIPTAVVSISSSATNPNIGQLIGPSGASLRPGVGQPVPQPVQQPLPFNNPAPQGQAPYVDTSKPCPACTGGPATFPGPQPGSLPSPQPTFPGPQPGSLPSPQPTFPGPQPGTLPQPDPLTLKLRLQRDLEREQQQLQEQQLTQEQQQIERFEELEQQQQSSEQIEQTIREKLALLQTLNEQIAQTQQSSSELQTTVQQQQQITPQVASGPSFVGVLGENFQRFLSDLQSGAECATVFAEFGVPPVVAAGLCLAYQKVKGDARQLSQWAQQVWQSLTSGEQQTQPQPKPNPVQFCVTCESPEDALKYQSGQGSASCYLVEGSYRNG
jgi:hypothetical protein